MFLFLNNNNNLKIKTIQTGINHLINKNKNNKTENNLNKGSVYYNNLTTFKIKEIMKEIQSYKNVRISFDKKSDFVKRDNPKISLIIPLHNQVKYIKLIYASIQNQVLKDIEIIFIDDNSEDNTTMMIRELIDQDKRIVYLKNKRNRGAFYTRNKGVLNAKGEYILFADPDDLLINNILIKVYKTAKHFNLDIVQFCVLEGYYETPKLWRQFKYNQNMLKNNEEIRNYFYHVGSRNLWDKLIRKNIFIQSINFMNKKFQDQLYYINNDDTAIFGLIHVANTYGFLEEIGYFYIKRPKGSYYYRHDPKNMNLIFHSIFNNMKYFYLQSDNNNVAKNNLAYKYFYSQTKKFAKYLPYVTNGFDYFVDILNLYLNSTYFTRFRKQYIIQLKLKIIDTKKKVMKLFII